MTPSFDSVTCASLLFISWLVTAGEPPALRISESTNNSVKIEWTGGGILETSLRPPQGWTELAGGQTSPVVVRATETTAFFRLKLRMFSLSVSKSGDGGGAVLSQPAGVDCGPDCQESFLEGTVVQLTPQALQGSNFGGWTGDAAGTGTVSVVMNGPRNVTANFVKTAVDPLINGDFEQGPQIGWLQYPGHVIYRAAELGIPVASGQYVARLGYDRDDRSAAGIGQELILPNIRPLYLICSIWIISQELCDVPYWDSIGFYVNGDAVEENTRVCRSNGPTDGWERDSFDTSASASQPVLLGFEVFGGTLASALFLDDVVLSQVPE